MNKFIVFVFLTNILLATLEKPLVVVIPSYNNKFFYEKNLQSVFSQKYENYRIIYIDDASPDGTGELVRQYVHQSGQTHRFLLIQNMIRQKALANIYKAVWLCRPDEIVVNLDGDDFLAHPEVFSLLNRTYSSGEVWLTYGKPQFFPSNFVPNIIEIPKEIIENNAFRSIRATGTTALRTFYAALFQHIKIEDLQENGEFFPVAYDMAIMFPMLEMAGSHAKFIPDICYIYNSETTFNDHTTQRAEQTRIDEFVRNKQKYLPLEKLL